MAGIEIKNLTVSYKRNSKDFSINIPELIIPSGEIVGIFGPNYVGKSTLLKLFSQLHFDLNVSSKSSILYDNFKFDKSSNTPLILHVPQDYHSSILPWFSIEDNLRIILKSLSTPENLIEEKVNSFCKDLNYPDEITLFKDFGFSSKENIKNISQLSGGQLQILSILRTLLPTPSIITMDEPFSAIDIYKGKKLRNILMKYVQEKEITTIIVAHELEELISLTNKIIFLNHDENGEIIKGIENSNVSDEDIESVSDFFKDKYNLN